MLRSFCVGALVGFFLGSTKKGQDFREGIDGFLTELTSSDTMKVLEEKKDELTEFAFKSSKSLGKPAKKSDEQNFEPEAAADEQEEKGAPKALDADKAQELADKLGAKPSAPEDENIAAFHAEDELKSA